MRRPLTLAVACVLAVAAMLLRARAGLAPSAPPSLALLTFAVAVVLGPAR